MIHTELRLPIKQFFFLNSFHSLLLLLLFATLFLQRLVCIADLLPQVRRTEIGNCNVPIILY